jgi:hypothetical protein
MESGKNTIFGFVWVASALAMMVWGCSSAPIKVECRELQARIDYGDLTGDQLRFAMQELDDCRNRVKSAEEKDSAFIEGANERFTPSDSQ